MFTFQAERQSQYSQTNSGYIYENKLHTFDVPSEMMLCSHAGYPSVLPTEGSLPDPAGREGGPAPTY